MKIQYKLFAIFFALFVLVNISYAESIYLKSGHKVDVKILERKADCIKVDVSGVPITYYNDEIISIDGRPVATLDAGTNVDSDAKESKSYGRFAGKFYYIGDLDQAIFYYKKAIEESPNKPGFYDDLGSAYLRKGLFEEAAEVLEKRVALQKEAGAYLSLISIYTAQGRFSEAKELINDLIKFCKNKGDDKYMPILELAENTLLPGVEQYIKTKPTQARLGEIKTKLSSADRTDDAQITINQMAAYDHLRLIKLACRLYKVENGTYPDSLESIIKTKYLSEEAFDISESPPLADGYLFIYNKDDENYYVGAKPFVYGKSGRLYFAISNKSDGVVVDENENNRPDPGEPAYNPS